MSEPANELREALDNFAAEMARTLVPWWTAASKVLQALANDPVVRFAMEHPELPGSRAGQRMSGETFAKGGIVPGASRDDDSVPAILSRGCAITSREQAEAIGLTVEATRLPPEDEVSDEFKQQAKAFMDQNDELMRRLAD
jgi:hypothetical protein